MHWVCVCEWERLVCLSHSVLWHCTARIRRRRRLYVNDVLGSKSFIRCVSMYSMQLASVGSFCLSLFGCTHLLRWNYIEKLQTRGIQWNGRVSQSKIMMTMEKLWQWVWNFLFWISTSLDARTFNSQTIKCTTNGRHCSKIVSILFDRHFWVDLFVSLLVFVGLEHSLVVRIRSSDAAAQACQRIR